VVENKLTGAIFGSPLIAPDDPTGIEGKRKSINPSIARKGISGYLRG
jgi:hypothetical protein